MDCAIESTPSEETCIYTSVLEGGRLMQQFEDDESQELPDDGGEPRRQEFPIRASGVYATVDNPWPRNAEKETRDIAGAAKRKPYPHRRQGNRWDQYGESSSAASSEAHIASDHVHSESTWGPYESAHRDKRAAQPYRLQTANRGEANGPDGRVTSDSHSRTTGVNLLCGSHLPAMTARGRECLNGKDHNGPPRLEGP